ncbi:DUF2339 domain-containing protein [Neisseria sp. Ec49-e6-T10]|uniref:DUF2339 domain-containing protein n=1 Tax=Neisseria sp. Ec49-e6-T10 TaxID=3140744 RepID=UPI003EBE905B
MFNTLMIVGIVYLIFVLHSLTNKMNKLNERLNTLANELTKKSVPPLSDQQETIKSATDLTHAQNINHTQPEPQPSQLNRKPDLVQAEPNHMAKTSSAFASPSSSINEIKEPTQAIIPDTQKEDALLAEFTLTELTQLNQQLNSQPTTHSTHLSSKQEEQPQPIPQDNIRDTDHLIIEKALNPKTIKQSAPTPTEQPSFLVHNPLSTNNTAHTDTDKEKTTKNYQIYSSYRSLLQWFVQGNPVAKIGVILLFFGIGYFMKFSIERDLIPVSIRFILAMSLCVTVFGSGWYLRKKNELYGLILEGGGIGGLYITVFASVTLYQLLSVPLAFLLMVLFCIICVGFAYKQSAKSLAILAALGGYAAPLLLSTGSNNYLILFSYYSLISSGLFITNIKKSWRELNLIGFIFTFVVGLIWGLKYYQSSIYISSQLFLLFNLILFGILSITLASKHQIKHQGIVDGSLVFGSAIIGFLMQYYLTKHWEYGPAISALLFGVFYILLAYILSKALPQIGKRITLSYLIIGVSLTTLATPLAFDADVTSIVWALQAVALLWLGLDQNNKQMAFGSVVLLFVSVILSYVSYLETMTDNSFYSILSILSICYFISAWLWFKESKNNILFHYKFIQFETTNISHIFLYLGLIFWSWLLAEGSYRFAVQQYLTELYASSSALALIIFTCSTVVLYLLSIHLKWKALLEKTVLLWLVLLIAFFIQILTLEHNSPLAMGTWSLCWPIAIITALCLLAKMENYPVFFSNIKTLHLSLFWVTLSLIALQIHHVFSHNDTETTYYSAFLIFFDLVCLLIYCAFKANKWPFTEKNFNTYWLTALIPVITLIILLLIKTNITNGLMSSGYYLPVFNVFELPAILALWILWTWFITCIQKGLISEKQINKTGVFVFVGLLSFWLLNGMILRTLSHLLDLPWQFEQLWGSRIVQMTFSLIWAMLSLILMRASNKNKERNIWIIGAFLLTIVIVKLFFIDAAKTNGIERAITFIGVAILVLIIGYISPLPPKKQNKKAEE